jgi:hypothetical protein
MAYAHMHIEDREADGTVTWYAPGEEVPESVNGYDDLVEQGAIKDEPYDPDAQPKALPEYVEIDGVRYERAAPQEDTDAAE